MKIDEMKNNVLKAIQHKKIPKNVQNQQDCYSKSLDLFLLSDAVDDDNITLLCTKQLECGGIEINQNI